tara:strand:- start:24079 stop:25830 length:1752 start_codon:yes stop_codon:yes gene_type:complete
MTERLFFDLETNGLLDELDTIHCIGVYNPDTKEYRGYKPDEVDSALLRLSKADEIIGHNVIGFDIPAIKKVKPGWETEAKITDTLILSRLIYSDLKREDWDAMRSFPRRLYGSHSLAAWGHRLDNHKGDYSGGWEAWNEDMHEYMEQDVRLTAHLYQTMRPWDWSERSIELEHAIAWITEDIGSAGWTLDQKKASELYAELAQRRQELDVELQDLFEPWETTEVFIPKRNNKTMGYVAGEPFTKRKTIYFNYNSRRQIEFCLRRKYGWEPEKLTGDGHAQIDDVVLASLPYPEAKKLAEVFLIQKRIGQLAEGKQAWLKKVDNDGRLRHRIISGGCISGRASHVGPNLAQVPATRLKYGKECRELFTVQPGYSLVGADLSGLELRCLAHFLNDGGAYAKEILSGDIHSANQHSAGLDTRDQAKTFIYTLIFGGGDAKLGHVVGSSPTAGRKLRDNFFKAVPAFKELKTQLGVASEKGWIYGLDKRRLKVRSQHSVMSTLIQSAGAVLCKQWLLLVDRAIKDENLDAQIIAWVHDEVQIQVKKGEEDHVGHIARRAAQEAGEAFGFRCPIAAEYSIGRTWADTH